MNESLNNYKSCPSHCCVVHGCKYGYEHCPVTTGKIIQEYHCEYCPSNFDPNIHYNIELNEDLFKSMFYNKEYDDDNMSNNYIWHDPQEEIKEGAYINFISVNSLTEKTGEVVKVIIEKVTQEDDSLFNSFKVSFTY